MSRPPGECARDTRRRAAVQRRDGAALRAAARLAGRHGMRLTLVLGRRDTSGAPLVVTVRATALGVEVRGGRDDALIGAYSHSAAGRRTPRRPRSAPSS